MKSRWSDGGRLLLSGHRSKSWDFPRESQLLHSVFDTYVLGRLACVTHHVLLYFEK